MTEGGRSSDMKGKNGDDSSFRRVHGGFPNGLVLKRMN